MMKIMIVEDDTTISGAVAAHLEGWGYTCIVEENFRNVMLTFAAESPSLVLLDITLPFYDGYYWCREIRRVSQVPVIFISSACDNMNIVMAVNMGGDDFISKPFDLSVLSAKVQAIMRRTYDFNSPSDLIEHDGVILNLTDYTLTSGDGVLELAKNEFRILQTLFETRGQPVSREKLMKRLWETDIFVDENTLNVNVARLRRRLEEIGRGDMIVTKKGIGYMIK